MASGSPPLWALGLFFLKIGAVLYGSGYVLAAYLRGGLTPGGPLAGLTDVQLLDAIAIGQFTPGPILSTATFVGYLVAQWPGAVMATAAIFLPSFVYVALMGPLVPRLRRWKWAAAFLDAATAASLGLLAAVTLQLGAAALGTWPSWLIAAAAGVAVFRWRLAPAWLVVGGAIANWLMSLTPFVGAT
jgi:chromate transporter